MLFEVENKYTIKFMRNVAWTLLILSEKQLRYEEIITIVSICQSLHVTNDRETINECFKALSGLLQNPENNISDLFHEKGIHRLSREVITTDSGVELISNAISTHRKLT